MLLALVSVVLSSCGLGETPHLGISSPSGVVISALPYTGSWTPYGPSFSNCVLLLDYNTLQRVDNPEPFLPHTFTIPSGLSAGSHRLDLSCQSPTMSAYTTFDVGTP